MANILDRFNKKIIGSKGKISDYVSVIDSSGDFKRINDINVILNSWKNILLTPKRTYDHDPEFGCGIHEFLFEPTDVKTEEKIKNEIMKQISKYDNRATIKEIKIIFYSNKKGFIINLTVEYKKQQETMKIKIDESIFENDSLLQTI